MPFLELLADGGIHHAADFADTLASQFDLAEHERDERTPSGKRTRVLDRVLWTSTYLSQAGLVERTSRGYVRITPRGRAILDKQPPRLDSDCFAED